MSNNKNPIRIAVFVSGSGTNLQALINAQHTGIITDGIISLVISDKAEAYAIERAKKADIPYLIVCKNDYKDQRAMEDKISSALEEHNIGLIVLAGFMRILSKAFTDKYKKRILNVHPSLIPSFCGEGFYGLRVHEAALAKGVKVTGATVHFVNEIPDGGEIIMQKAVTVRPDDTPKTLQKRVMRLAEWKILPLSVQKVCNDILKGEY